MKSKITRSLTTLILGVFILFLINSCKKELLTTPQEDLISTKITKNGVSLESINFKTFKTEVDFNKLGKLKTTFEKGSEFNTHILLDANANSNIEIDLDHVKKLSVKGKTSYVFSIKPITPRAVSFSNLTIELNENKDSVKAFMTVYTPKKEWIKAYQNNHILPFDGKIEFEKIELNQINNVKQGIGSLLSTNSSSPWIQVCLSYTVYEHVEIPCPTGHLTSDGNACILWGEPTGARIEVQSRQVTECSTIADPSYDEGTSNPGGSGGSSGGSGGSTTPTPPGDYNPCDSGGGETTINSVNGMQVLVAGDTPCEPSSPDLPPTSSASFIINRDISITNNSKISCILNRLEGKDSNGNNAQTKYDDLLLAFSNNNNWNLTYKLEVIPNSPLGKITLGKRRGPENLSGVNNFEIVFNANETGRYEIEIAKTFIHEAFHAYLAQKALETWGTVNPLLWKNETKDLDLMQLLNYIEIEKGKDLGDLGHDFMINNIDKMKVVLKEFMDPNSQSSISDDAYLGWLYQGLEGTNFYENNVGTSSVVKQYNGNSYTLRQYYNQIAAELLTIDIDCL
jgi:hypothetical protein